MENKKLNDKIFTPINKNEMSCIVGGKIVIEYYKTHYMSYYNMSTGELVEYTKDEYRIYDIDEWGNSKYVGFELRNDPK